MKMDIDEILGGGGCLHGQWIHGRGHSGRGRGDKEGSGAGWRQGLGLVIMINAEKRGRFPTPTVVGERRSGQQSDLHSSRSEFPVMAWKWASASSLLELSAIPPPPLPLVAAMRVKRGAKPAQGYKGLLPDRQAHPSKDRSLPKTALRNVPLPLATVNSSPPSSF